MRLAIDIGGTFTDIVLEDKTNLLTKKVLTSTSQPEVAVIEGVEEFFLCALLTGEDVNVIHKKYVAVLSILGSKVLHFTTFD